MNVIFDHSIFSIQSHGGISRYFCELLASMREFEDVNPEVIAPLYVSRCLKDDPSLPVRGYFLPKFEKTYKVVQAINNSCGSWLLRNKDVDIFHSTYYLSKMRPAKGIPVIITVFDMIHELYPELLPKWEMNIQARKKEAVLRADHVICISRQTRDDLVELLHVPESKTSVVHLGTTFSADMVSTQAPLLSRPYILYVGQRDGPKNFSRLIEAFAAVIESKLNLPLVCFGGGVFTSREAQFFKDKNLTGQQIIHLEGDDQVLRNLYQNATVFVYPSLYEGFGLPLLEAMACKCPVVCSNASVLPEVAGEAAYYFDPLEIDDMVDALVKTINSTEKQESLIIKGLERVSNFSWESCAGKTVDVYKKCV